MVEIKITPFGDNLVCLDDSFNPDEAFHQKLKGLLSGDMTRMVILKTKKALEAKLVNNLDLYYLARYGKNVLYGNVCAYSSFPTLQKQKMSKARIFVFLFNEVNECFFLLVQTLKRYVIPGGTQDDRDSSVLDTAVRETREETSIIIQPHQLVSFASPQTIWRTFCGLSFQCIVHHFWILQPIPKHFPKDLSISTRTSFYKIPSEMLEQWNVDTKEITNLYLVNCRLLYTSEGENLIHDSFTSKLDLSLVWDAYTALR